MIRRWFALLLVCSGLLAHEPAYSNHLSGETSPYLQQHVHNPVDWYPWGDAAFEKAKREHKPIFLSIGFSTCHWCHVMAEESFEDPKIAAMLNRWFVAIKVDREEMPDIDAHFQALYRRMHGRSGGWPLTVLLTEEGRPFFTGTYIPPTDAYGIDGMLTLLPRVGRGYRADKRRFALQAQRLEEDKSDKAAEQPLAELPDADTIAYKALREMASVFDERYKGFGTRPKFPPTSRIGLLFDIYRLTKAPQAKSMATQTLAAMADSGLYDQVEGAFFRYSTDRAWTQPHFEKMLYTNAQLVSAYVVGWKADGNPRFKTVVRETIAEMSKRFQTKEGLWFAASSADSDTGEGGYFLYGYDEADAALEKAGFLPSERRVLLKYFSIEEDGNVDGEVSHVHLSAAPVPKGAQRAKEVLKALRKTRQFPFMDRKVITAWNAMMIAALFDASALDSRYAAMAERSYASLRAALSNGDSELFHQTLYGHRPTQPGLLEDYAYMIQAAIRGYEATFEKHYLEEAARWSKTAMERFYDNGRWRLGNSPYSAYDDGNDKYYSSPMALMMKNLLELEVLSSDIRYEKPVLQTFRKQMKNLLDNPADLPALTAAYLRYRRGIVGIKQRAEVLRKKRAEIEKINYPFVLLEAEPNLDRWIACDARSCFAVSKTFEEIVRKVETYRPVSGSSSWRQRH
jgi:uncharacterized protein YyaL (SSP411 family)